MRKFTFDEITATMGTFEATEEDYLGLADSLRNDISQEDTATLCANILEETERCASPADKEAMKEWRTYDRLLWILREAFVCGFIQGTKISCQAAQMGLDELHKAAEESES